MNELTEEDESIPVNTNLRLQSLGNLIVDESLNLLSSPTDSTPCQQKDIEKHETVALATSSRYGLLFITNGKKLYIFEVKNFLKKFEETSLLQAQNTRHDKILSFIKQQQNQIKPIKVLNVEDSSSSTRIKSFHIIEDSMNILLALENSLHLFSFCNLSTLSSTSPIFSKQTSSIKKATFFNNLFAYSTSEEINLIQYSNLTKNTRLLHPQNPSIHPHFSCFTNFKHFLFFFSSTDTISFCSTSDLSVNNILLTEENLNKEKMKPLDMNILELGQFNLLLINYGTDPEADLSGLEYPPLPILVIVVLGIDATPKLLGSYEIENPTDFDGDEDPPFDHRIFSHHVKYSQNLVLLSCNWSPKFGLISINENGVVERIKVLNEHHDELIYPVIGTAGYSTLDLQERKSYIGSAKIFNPIRGEWNIVLFSTDGTIELLSLINEEMQTEKLLDETFVTSLEEFKDIIGENVVRVSKIYSREYFGSLYDKDFVFKRGGYLKDDFRGKEISFKVDVQKQPWDTKDFLSLITKIYKEFNPEKIQNVDNLVQKYSNAQMELVKKLEDKYSFNHKDLEKEKTQVDVIHKEDEQKEEKIEISKEEHLVKEVQFNTKFISPVIHPDFNEVRNQNEKYKNKIATLEDQVLTLESQLSQLGLKDSSIVNSEKKILGKKDIESEFSISLTSTQLENGQNNLDQIKNFEKVARGKLKEINLLLDESFKANKQRYNNSMGSNFDLDISSLEQKILDLDLSSTKQEVLNLERKFQLQTQIGSRISTSLKDMRNASKLTEKEIFSFASEEEKEIDLKISQALHSLTLEYKQLQRDVDLFFSSENSNLSSINFGEDVKILYGKLIEAGDFLEKLEKGKLKEVVQIPQLKTISKTPRRSNLARRFRESGFQPALQYCYSKSLVSSQVVKPEFSESRLIKVLREGLDKEKKKVSERRKLLKDSLEMKMNQVKLLKKTPLSEIKLSSHPTKVDLFAKSPDFGSLSDLNPPEGKISTEQLIKPKALEQKQEGHKPEVKEKPSAGFSFSKPEAKPKPFFEDIDFKKELTLFYQKYNKDKISSVDQTLEKYKTNLKKLFENLYKKYKITDSDEINIFSRTQFKNPEKNTFAAVPSSSTFGQQAASNPFQTTPIKKTADLFSTPQQSSPFGTPATTASPFQTPQTRTTGLINCTPSQTGFGSSGFGSSGFASTGIDYRQKLVDFYTKHNPGKLSSVDSTLAKYKGKEQELFQKLEKKYGSVANTNSGGFSFSNFGTSNSTSGGGAFGSQQNTFASFSTNSSNAFSSFSNSNTKSFFK
eukprot:snap_masked-scaffold_19-processed-gene-0.6-mRNA-1 protein AED:1.00 eAED:1.00 QI:0/0/0/0/1/1/2/0/1289